MVITYYGGQCFKVQFGDTILGFDPMGTEALPRGKKPPRFGADVAFVSTYRPECNAVHNLASKEKEPFVIAGPGEYEIKEVFIKGYPSKAFSSENSPEKEDEVSNNEEESSEQMNTIYSVKLEGLHLVFVGALGHIGAFEQIQDLGEVDVVFVPIGGGSVLSAREGYQVAVKMGAKLVVPMHYEDLAAEDGALETFAGEAGLESTIQKQSKLSFKPKDLAGKEGEVAVLEKYA